MMKKLVIAVITAFLAIVMPLCAMAAPSSLPASTGTGYGNLITVTNPPSFSSTTQRGVVFCGYGESGTVIYFYQYNSASGTYQPIYVNGVRASVTINASGVFWKKIDLSSGYHKVIVYAQKGSSVQSVKREVNVLSPNIADRFKDYTVNITF